MSTFRSHLLWCWWFRCRSAQLAEPQKGPLALNLDLRGAQDRKYANPLKPLFPPVHLHPSERCPPWIALWSALCIQSSRSLWLSLLCYHWAHTCCSANDTRVGGISNPVTWCFCLNRTLWKDKQGSVYRGLLPFPNWRCWNLTNIHTFSESCLF